MLHSGIVLEHLFDYKRTYAFFQQDSTTAHTTNGCLLFESFWWQNSKQRILVSSFASYKTKQFLC